MGRRAIYSAQTNCKGVKDYHPFSKRRIHIMYVFEAIVASRGYHVFKNTTWSDARVGEFVEVQLETNRNSKQVDPYACAIRTKHFYYDAWRTVGHIPREISRHAFYFLSAEGGLITGHVHSIDQRYSPIPNGGLEIPLKLKFSHESEEILTKMKTFVGTLYDYNFTGTGASEESEGEDEEMEIVIQNEPTDGDDSQIVEPQDAGSFDGDSSDSSAHNNIQPLLSQEEIEVVIID